MLIAIRKDFHTSVILCAWPLEITSVTARLAHVPCAIGMCYRPPDSGPEFIEPLNNYLYHVLNKHPNSVAVLDGDFNYPVIGCARTL